MNGLDIETKVIGTLIGMIVIIMILCTIYNMHRNYLISASDNPLATACALSDSDAKPCMAYLGSLK